MTENAAELRQFIEQVESLTGERNSINEQINEVFAEAKARGYDVPTLKALIKERAQDADKLAEQEALLEIYKNALEG